MSCTVKRDQMTMTDRFISYLTLRNWSSSEDALLRNSVRTAKKTQFFTITKINWLMLFKNIIAIYSENCTKFIIQNERLLINEVGWRYNYHWSLKVKWTCLINRDDTDENTLLNDGQIFTWRMSSWPVLKILTTWRDLGKPRKFSVRITFNRLRRELGTYLLASLLHLSNWWVVS
jgi:hypothetical protein